MEKKEHQNIESGAEERANQEFTEKAPLAPDIENAPEAGKAKWKHVQPRTDIKGWAIDADPKNDPTYPMKLRMGEEHLNYTWERPPQQPVDIEVLTSIERPNLPAVFGTAVPPRGLSGRIRRWAFKYGEGRFAHWLPLIMADRIDVVEGVLEDIRNGYFPNIWAEKGFRAKWKYNKKEVITKMAITAGVAAAVIFLIARQVKNSANGAEHTHDGVGG